MSDTIFYDVDTQLDFMLPVGTLYVGGAEKIIPALKRLTEFAAANHIPIMSSADAHAPQDPEFANWPPHCVAGTWGQHKVPETVLPGAVVIPNSSGPLPADWERAPQIIIEKQTLDVFETQTVSRLLEKRTGARFVVYGVVTEICVLRAASGLLQRGARVEIVTDAIRELNGDDARRALDELKRAGAREVTVAEVTGGEA